MGSCFSSHEVEGHLILPYSEWVKQFTRHASTVYTHKFVSASALALKASDLSCDASGEISTTSTALGYGLLISALAGDTELFHAIHDYRRLCIDDLGLLPAAMQINKAPFWCIWAEDKHVACANGWGICGSIFEGDCHAALGYVVAACTFNHGDPYRRADYLTAARTIVSSLETRCIHSCTSHPLIGDIPDESGKLWMINRMAGVSYTHLTCPSDFCLWRFEKFAQAVPSHSNRYLKMKDACIATILSVVERYSPHLGLLPEVLQWNHSQQSYVPAAGCVLFPEGKRAAGAFSYMACKYPLQLAVYYYHSHDLRVLPVMLKLGSFYGQHATKQGLGSGYNLDGTVTSQASDLAFLVGGLAVTKVLQLPAAGWYESAIRAALSLETFNAASIAWTEGFGHSGTPCTVAPRDTSSLPISHPPPQLRLQPPSDAQEAASRARHAAQLSSGPTPIAKPPEPVLGASQLEPDATSRSQLGACSQNKLGLGKTLLMLFQLQCKDLFDPTASPRFPPNALVEESLEEAEQRARQDQLLSSDFDNEVEESYRQALQSDMDQDSYSRT